MPQCQELKNQIAQVQADNNLQELLNAYKKSGDEDILDKFETKSNELELEYNDIDRLVENAAQQLLGDWYTKWQKEQYLSDFLDIIMVRDGKVILDGNLNMVDTGADYFPKCISVAKGELFLKGTDIKKAGLPATGWVVKC